MSEANKPAVALSVLAWDGNQWVRAIWVPRYALDQGYDEDEEGDWSDYNPADDTYYWLEGWYELQSHGGKLKYWRLNDGATHWIPLPPPPKEPS